MLARSSSIQHPSSDTLDLQTPLLVPSFSSKGFGTSKKSGKPEVYDLFKVAKEMLTDSMLISAYDLHYKHIPKQINLTEITVVDSGGYETSDVFEISSTLRSRAEPKPWSVDLYRKILEKWPPSRPAIFVSYDDDKHHYGIPRQIKEARSLLSNFPQHLSLLLLKPDRHHRYQIPMQAILDNISDIAAFDIVGATEKELGSSTLERMTNIAKIRRSLDAINASNPIHVFGGLDPLSVLFYFISGAEIFDGLTWLRYGYIDGHAVYRQNFAARNDLIFRNDDLIQAKMMQANLTVLAQLERQMQKFVLEHDYDLLKDNGPVVKQAELSLKTQLGRGDHHGF